MYDRSQDNSTRLETAISELLEAISVYDTAEVVTLAVIESWRDMSFDDRRYLGTAFPRLVDALNKLEDHHRDD